MFVITLFFCLSGDPSQCYRLKMPSSTTTQESCMVDGDRQKVEFLLYNSGYSVREMKCEPA